MKKAGIITFHRAVNYGACLQAYALKRVLNALEIDAEIIDYRNSEIENTYKKIIQNGSGIKNVIKNIMTWHIQKKRNDKFEEFLDEYVLEKEQECYFDNFDLVKANNIYDVFISGSDQVWSPLCAANYKTYMLNFVDKKSKKYSYAASFGVVDSNYLHDKEIKRLLSEYEFLSVREQKGIEIISDIFDESRPNNCAQHIDPTFLLTKNQWQELTKTPICSEKYIFIYSLSMPDEIVNYAKKIATEKNLKIKCFTLNNVYTMLHPLKVINGSPLEFLSYFANAEYVVTNSFHGTAFSIIFNKEFSVVKNINPNHDNSRLTSILNILGLDDRLISNIDSEKELKKIDYTKINKRLTNIRSESMDYLKKIVKETDKGGMIKCD